MKNEPHNFSNFDHFNVFNVFIGSRTIEKYLQHPDDRQIIPGEIFEESMTIQGLLEMANSIALLSDKQEIEKNIDALQPENFPWHLPKDIIIKIAAMTATRNLHTEVSSQEIAQQKSETLAANASQLFKLHTERTQNPEKQHAFDQRWGLIKK